MYMGAKIVTSQEELLWSSCGMWWDGENKHFLPHTHYVVVAPFIFRVLGDSVDSPPKCFFGD
jgi:hypothetical protein